MNKIILTVLVVVAAVAAMTEAKKCRLHGIAYNPGDTYKDDCNSCTCMESGNGACSRMGCPPKVCEHKGVKYGAGESFKDDCNTCTCSSNGAVGCTRMGCRP